MNDYLIEVRIGGYAKKYTTKVIKEISNKFQVKGVTRKRPVPHLTLAGPFQSDKKTIMKVIKVVENICKHYDVVPFHLHKFKYLTDSKGKKVVYIDVEPSKALDELRWNLAVRLDKIIELKHFQRNRDFKFHATIAFKDIDQKFNQIWKFLQNKKDPNIISHALRITILHKGRIVCEYDLLQKRILNRRQALNRQGYRRSIDILLDKTTVEQPVSITDKIKRLFNKKKVFITSDHHFYHNNIIKYCNRPYNNVFEMNEDMINKWNNVVSKNDIVYHLGDFALTGEGDEYFRKIKKIRNRLKGKIYILIGNHDKKGNRVQLLRKAGFKIINKKYIIKKNLILSHSPLSTIKNGYVNVHGHIHEKEIDGPRINACVDVTNFEPKPIRFYLKKSKEIINDR